MLRSVCRTAPQDRRSVWPPSITHISVLWYLFLCRNNMNTNTALLHICARKVAIFKISQTPIEPHHPSQKHYVQNQMWVTWPIFHSSPVTSRSSWNVIEIFPPRAYLTNSVCPIYGSNDPNMGQFKIWFAPYIGQMTQIWGGLKFHLTHIWVKRPKYGAVKIQENQFFLI